MTKCQLILTVGFFSVTSVLGPTLPVSFAAPPYSLTSEPAARVAQAPGQPQQVVPFGPPPVAVGQPQPELIPLPSPPSQGTAIFGPPVGAPTVTAAPGMPPGVIVGPAPGQPGMPVAAACPPNTILVPVVDENLAWDQIADVVDDYFRIFREQRARRSGEAWTEGYIETAALDGATWLEPFRKDSVGSFNRWESTFQSIRRRATVRVIPDPNGYLVEVIVLKELEDLPKSIKATAGPAAFNSDQTLPSQRLADINRTRASRRWIQLGRDPALEQRMLADIQARLAGRSVPQSMFGE